MLEENTKHLIRTPFGNLTLSFEAYTRFATCDERAQWGSLMRLAYKGEHDKARAMQWFWTQRALRDYKGVN